MINLRITKNQLFPALGEDVMPVVGFYAPPDESEWQGKQYSSLKTDAVFQKIKEAGFNVTFQMNDPIESKPESVARSIVLCEKYGIQYMVCSDTLYRKFNWREEDNIAEETEKARALLTVQRFKEALAPYVSRKSFAGLYVWDEPTKEALPYLGEILSVYRQAITELGYPEKTYYVNLLPWLAGSGLNAKEYDEYLSMAVEKAGLEYLSYDFYPFRKKEYIRQSFPEVDTGISPGVFNLTAQVREVALRYDVPFWAFVQMGGNWSEETDNISVRRPLPSEVLWEVNLFLAFGAKGIQYFTLCNPVSYFKYLKNGGETGAFLPDGTPSDLYEAAREANCQIAACDEILMHCKSTQMILHGPAPTVIEYSVGIVRDTNYRELLSVSGAPAFIGCFDFKGKTVLYVLHNRATGECGEIELLFGGRQKLRIIDATRDERKEDSRLKFCLKAGAAVLVSVE